MNAPATKDKPVPRLSKKANDSGLTTTALVLSQLKFPLVFFGLALIVTEGLFGIALNRSSSQTTVVVIVGCMTGLFLVSIAVVGLLVWKVPTHIMLTAQTRAPEDVLEQLRRARVAAQILEKWGEQPRTPDSLIQAIEMIELFLRGQTPSSEVDHV